MCIHSGTTIYKKTNLEECYQLAIHKARNPGKALHNYPQCDVHHENRLFQVLH